MNELQGQVGQRLFCTRSGTLRQQYIWFKLNSACKVWQWRQWPLWLHVGQRLYNVMTVGCHWQWTAKPPWWSQLEEVMTRGGIMQSKWEFMFVTMTFKLKNLMFYELPSLWCCHDRRQRCLAWWQAYKSCLCALPMARKCEHRRSMVQILQNSQCHW